MVAMPEGAMPLDVQVQSGVITLWALVNPDARPVPRPFSIYGTGHTIENIGELSHIGTVQMGCLVWHVFEATETKSCTRCGVAYLTNEAPRLWCDACRGEAEIKVINLRSKR